MERQQRIKDDATEYEPTDYFDGEASTLRSLPVHPQPRQEPHPQRWRPTMTPESAAWIARRGLNGCCYAVVFDDVRALVDAYRDAAADADWPDRRPEFDGEPFRRGWAADRRRGIAPSSACSTPTWRTTRRSSAGSAVRR